MNMNALHNLHWFRRCTSAARYTHGLVLCVLLGTALVCWGESRAGHEESRLKTVLVARFAKYTAWPVDVMTRDADAPLIITAVDRAAFQPYFDALSKKTFRGRELVFVDADTLRRTGRTPDMVYINTEDAAEMQRVLDTYRGLPVLTVGEGNAFAHNGGMIGMVYSGRKIRLAINVDAAQSVGLQLSSDLLSLSQVDLVTRPADKDNE